MRNKLRVVLLIIGFITSIYFQILIIQALKVYNGFTYFCLVGSVICSGIHIESAIISDGLDKIRRNIKKQQKKNESKIHL